jgi:hypothetical protein
VAVRATGACIDARAGESPRQLLAQPPELQRQLHILWSRLANVGFRLVTLAKLVEIGFPPGTVPVAIHETADGYEDAHLSPRDRHGSGPRRAH